MRRAAYKKRSSRRVQRSRSNSKQDNYSGGSGNLDSESRLFMESRFKTDLGNVKINDDVRSSKAAAGLDARAFTIGENIHFSKGEYNPKTIQGKRLLAHELTHVIQQRHGNKKIQTKAKNKNADTITQKNDIEGTEESVINKNAKRYERIIKYAESAILAADNALAAKEFPVEKLTRIKTLANKLKPLLNELRKAEQGGTLSLNLSLDFDPKKDWIDKNQASLSSEDIINDFGLNDDSKKVQKAGGIGLGLFIIALSLLLKGCKNNRKKFKKKYGHLLSRAVTAGPAFNNNCGATLGAKWILDKKARLGKMNGYIIQEVRYTYDVRDSGNSIINQYNMLWYFRRVRVKAKDKYYEAWPVRKGKLKGSGTDVFNIPCNKWKGNLKKEGWAKFVPNTTEPASWGNIPHLAGTLKATKNKPKNWDRTSTIYRMIGINGMNNTGSKLIKGTLISDP